MGTAGMPNFSALHVAHGTSSAPSGTKSYPHHLHHHQTLKPACANSIAGDLQSWVLRLQAIHTTHAAGAAQQAGGKAGMTSHVVVECTHFSFGTTSLKMGQP